MLMDEEDLSRGETEEGESLLDMIDETGKEQKKSRIRRRKKELIQ